MRINTRIFSSVSTKSLVFGFVIIMACAAFILTGFGSLNPRNLFGLDPNTAATVDSEKIDMQQFSAIISSRLPKEAPSEERKLIARQTIQLMIKDKVLSVEAKKIGWTASFSDLNNLIRNVPQFQNSTTNEYEHQLYKNYLASQQMSELNLLEYLKQQIEIQKMQNLLYLPTPYSPKYIEIQNKLNNTEFNLQYANVTISDSLLKEKVSAQAKSFVNDKANQESLNQLYQNSKNQFHQKAQVKALSILISYKTAQRASGDALKKTQEDAKKIANEILIKLKSGSDFATLASKSNDDIIAKKNKGNLGFVDETNIDPISAKAVLKLNSKNSLSEVIDTPFGYRIFKYVDGKPEITKSFDDVKLKLAEQLLGNQIKQNYDLELQKSLNEALAAKNLNKINTILSENKINWQYVSKLYKPSDSYINELGMANNLAQNIFSLKNPGDYIPKIIEFGAKKAIIKLVSRNLPTISNDQIESLKKQLMSNSSEEFAKTAHQSIYKNYDKNDKIKINPALLN